MKTSTLSVMALIGIGIVLTPVNLAAQSGAEIRVNVPFDFAVGPQALTAGKYIVRNLGPNVTQLYRADGSASKMVLTNSVVSNAREAKPCLIFHKTGDSYFLSQVWSGGVIGRALPVSKSEREMIAKLKPAGEVTLYAARH
jgi:hypothetical protein